MDGSEDRFRRPASSARFLAVVLAAALVFPVAGGCGRRLVSKTSELERVRLSSLGDRVLIVAPHPDDEGLATAGLIRQCIAWKKQVKVVLMTCGDASIGAVQAYCKKPKLDPADFRRVGVARAGESRAATGELGLPPKNLVFLGYPDGGINSLWGSCWDYNRLHEGLSGRKHCPYPFAYEKGAPYCGASLSKNLESIVKDYKPTTVIYPDEADEHHDHWAANAFVQYTLIKTKYSEGELTYLVHRHDFPYPMAEGPSDHLYPPAVLFNQNTWWEVLPLTESDENIKEHALQSYAIPRLVKELFIEAFVRRNELLGVDNATVARRIGDKKPDFSAPEMPYTVTLDPANDTAENSGTGGDIRKAGLCIGNKSAYLAAEAGGPIRNDLVYSFHLRLFRDSKVDRVDISVKEGKAYYLRLAKNSKKTKSSIRTGSSGNRLWVETPSSLFKKKRICLYNVDVLMGHRRADKTAWQRVGLE